MFRFKWLTPTSSPREIMIEIHLRIAQIPDTPNQRPILMFARIELNEQNARLQEVSLG